MQENKTLTLDPFETKTLSEVIDYVLETHHQYIRSQGPQILELFAHVCRSKGATYPELIQMKELFEVIYMDLLDHLMKEEQVLFPFCKQLDQANEKPIAPFGSVANPIRMMGFEHRTVQTQMQEMTELSHNFTPPQNICHHHQELYDALLAFFEDLHLHMQIEDEKLFPNAIQCEKERQVTQT